MYDDINKMVGKVMVSVENIDDEVLLFIDSDGVKYRFYHEQNCCESVTINDICGDLNDLVGVPILVAEEVSQEAPEVDSNLLIESYSWTFYKFSTIKGSVTVRWFGESNGYYSESVDFKIVG